MKKKFPHSSKFQIKKKKNLDHCKQLQYTNRCSGRDTVYKRTEELGSLYKPSLQAKRI
jgi:hypothetical protein